MKQREQALLLLKKAAQDEALLDEVLTSNRVSDELIGFHCQQAAEKMLKALLPDSGLRFRRTHELGALMAILGDAGHPLPGNLQDLDFLSPFGALYRYEDYDSGIALDRRHARQMLRSLRAWVESRLQQRTPSS